MRYIMLLMVVYTTSAAAQSAGIKIFTLQDGSIAPRINCIIQHSNGGLLLGTSAGLFYFNGISFEKIPLDTANASTQITALAEVNKNEVWLGFQNGSIAAFKNNAVKKLVFEEGQFGKAIAKIIKDSAGRIWCGTAGEGLYCYYNRRWINIAADNGLCDDYVYDLTMVSNTEILVATDNGIDKISWPAGANRSIRHFGPYEHVIVPGNNTIIAPRYKDPIVRKIYKQKTQSFLATQDSGFGWINTETGAGGIYINQWKYGQVNAVVPDGSTVWVGTEAYGLKRFDTESWHELQALPAALQQVKELIKDRSGNIWIVSNNQLIRTNGNKLTVNMPLGMLEYEQIHATFTDSAGHIWYNQNFGIKEVWTAGGMMRERQYNLPVTAKTDITSLHEDGQGNIWIGTMGKGVFVLHKASGNIRSINEDELLINGSVLSISGTKNTVWISSLGGAVKCEINNGQYKFTNYNDISGIGTNYIYNIFTDRKNRVWFATDGKGLVKLEAGQFTVYNEKQGLRSKVIYSVAEDKNGDIWINALNDGLYRFDGKRFHNFNAASGLSDNNTAAVISDEKGNIIAVSRKAIDVIAPGSLAVETYSAEQGLFGINTDLHSVSANNKGQIVFVSQAGIQTLCSAGTIRYPAAFIDYAELFLSAFNIDTAHIFKHNENNIGIHFNAVDLNHPDKIQFQYMLEGLGKTWVTTKDNYINFPKLPPGNYTFKVRASLNQQFENSPMASWSFTVKKPFWLRWWFIVLVILIAGFSIWRIVKYRENQLRKWQHLQRENLQSQLDTLKAQVSPHFLFNSMNTLVALIEEEPKTAVSYANHLSDLFRKIVQHRHNDTIPLVEEIALIEDYFFIQQKRFANGLVLENKLHPENSVNMQIAPLTLQLLVENAIKHNTFTKELPLVISIETNDGYLVVRNNLRVKPYPEAGAGMGLQNIQRRYKLLTGKEVLVERSKTHFSVFIPLIF